MDNTITSPQLNELLNDEHAEIILVDVRESWELERCKIDNCLHIPMNSIPESLHKLQFNLPIIVYCHHGMRSMQVVNFLASRGYNHVLNLEGGIHAWAQSVDPSMATY